MKTRTLYSTRDLLMMAALAALGGVASTYINTLGDLFQSVLGFAGTTQWAAGLHVLWLILAVGLTRKPGAGTVTGLLKGAVELLSGNTHGILILLIDLVAGVLVDLGLLPFWRKERLLGYALAGGLAAASNVFVFQLFAALPADLLSYGAMFLIGLIAFVSGVVFAGLLGFALLNSLRRSGAVKNQPFNEPGRRLSIGFILAGMMMAGALTVYLQNTLSGPAHIQIGGTVAHPYAFPASEQDLTLETRSTSQNGITRSYEGYPLADILTFSEPHPDAELLLLQASDGYGFFLTLEEVGSNPSLLLVPHDADGESAYDLVGAESPKAWVRNVTTITLIQGQEVPLQGALAAPMPFRPAEWQQEMDSASISMSSGSRKLQGVLVNAILLAAQPDPAATSVTFYGELDSVALPLQDILADDDLRLFIAMEADGMSFVLAHMQGDVLVEGVQRITVE